MIPHAPRHPYTVEAWATYLAALMFVAIFAAVAIIVVVEKVLPQLRILNGAL